MNIQEQRIKQYFHSWIKKDIDSFKDCFSTDIVYSECYGPKYHGIKQIEQWFIDWNKRGSVLDWQIRQFIHQGEIIVVEWFFQCNYEGEISGFDGVSIIHFDNNYKMLRVKEFQSKAEHYTPYGTL